MGLDCISFVGTGLSEPGLHRLVPPIFKDMGMEFFKWFFIFFICFKFKNFFGGFCICSLRGKQHTETPYQMTLHIQRIKRLSKVSCLLFFLIFFLFHQSTQSLYFNCNKFD